MLVLSRVCGERVRVRVPGGYEFWVSVVELDRNKVRLGFAAPREVEVMREEVIGRNQASPASEVAGG